MKYSLLATVVAITLAGHAQQCTVDWNNVHQRIDGFGASSAWRSTWTTAQADMFFSTNGTGCGLSLLRTRIVAAGSGSPSATPSTIEYNIMEMAQARGARVWSAPWTPAVAFKTTNSLNGGSYRGSGANPTNLAYASQLANYVVSMKNSYGVSLYAVSVQNEPDTITMGYESCGWSGAQIHDFVTNLHNAFVAAGVSSTKIVLPESIHWSSNPGLYTPSFNDANVWQDVGIFADHNYDGVNFDTGATTTPAALNSNGKALWETEVSTGDTFDGSISNAVYWASRIHLFMTAAQANAWHYWWLITANADNEGLTDISGNPAKRMYALGQYSRFVRPNFNRIDVSGNTANTLISAYKDSTSPAFAIVAVNSNATTSVNQTFNLANFTTTGSLTPWITSASSNLVALSPISVTGSSFTYTLPAFSVVTFVGQGQTNQAPTDIALSNASVPENQPPATTVGTFSTTDPNTGDTFTYTLVSGAGSTDNGSFTISGNTLQTTATFNYLTQNSYSIRVRSTDQGGLWVEKVFTVSVLAVPTDIGLSNSSVQEGQPSGTPVGTFSTTDSNGADTFAYTLVSGAGGTDNGSFTINGNTLQTAATFVYEVQNSYGIRVRSTTENGLWVEEPFTITVIDINAAPNTPTNLSPAAATVNVPLTVTLQASAFSDPNVGDSQAASEWLIQSAADNAVVIDTGTDAADTTSYGVPSGLLDYLTAYTWQVRYQDNHGAWSSYSIPTAFTSAPPSLFVAAFQGNVIVSWPTNADGFSLQFSTDLTSTNWNPVLFPPTVIGTQNVVTNATTNPASFFRLYKQQ
jgi:O-glycosyl hydrolase